MITLAFRNATPDCVSTDPVPSFRIDRELVTGGRDRLARHADHAWHVDGQRFLRMECEDARCWFSHRERRWRPAMVVSSLA